MDHDTEAEDIVAVNPIPKNGVCGPHTLINVHAENLSAEP